ncbi:hypothetical protein HPB49_004201 [Dermacentor silvarum]|uniref:Uncharacterized protein n=1 Tax=Dermacentor silvarum TaxID=543639 RepID=A0ACB8CV36_DERSI|nr:hypothetical protein HPB49_004201 [Dermacentor silvarum]
MAWLLLNFWLLFAERGADLRIHESIVVYLEMSDDMKDEEAYKHLYLKVFDQQRRLVHMKVRQHTPMQKVKVYCDRAVIAMVAIAAGSFLAITDIGP